MAESNPPSILSSFLRIVGSSKYVATWIGTAILVTLVYFPPSALSQEQVSEAFKYLMLAIAGMVGIGVYSTAKEDGQDKEAKATVTAARITANGPDVKSADPYKRV